MISMVMRTELLTTPGANPADTVFDSADAEIDAVSGGARCHAGANALFSSELAGLATMTYAQLHQAWRRHYRVQPPGKISRDILELGIAWKIQENRLGGLGAAVKRQIAELARTMDTKSGLAKPRAVSPKPGARLLRAWAGVTHEIVVTDEGFLWAGKTWASLSAIAREITGTRWSGPRFFGLTSASEKVTGCATTPVQNHE